MTINSYLTVLSKTAIVRDQEKASIQLSINTLKKRLTGYFGAQISDSYVFGSYSRGTILPRNMDLNSDVDYMVVFTDRSFRPQTYLDKLGRFVEQCYSSSEIYQSNPTIVLSMNHIKFEIVPAIHVPFYGLQIPAKASSHQNWLGTNPVGFNGDLVKANKSHNSLIKPLIRITKYWNAQNGYPFESFSLEQSIVEHGFWTRWASGGGQLADYFFDFMEDLNVGFWPPKWKHEIITRAKQRLAAVKEFEKIGNIDRAERELSKLFLAT